MVPIGISFSRGLFLGVWLVSLPTLQHHENPADSSCGEILHKFCRSRAVRRRQIRMMTNMWWRKVTTCFQQKNVRNPALVIFIMHPSSFIIIIIIVPSSKQPKQERYWCDSDVCFFPGQPAAGSSVPICWNFILPLPKRPRLFGNPGEVNRQVTTGSKVVSTHRTGTHPEQPLPTEHKGIPFIVG